jgi:hypothetical protein
MPPRRSFRQKPAWQSAGTPIISYLREGARVRVDFAYSPTRVKAVKGIAGASFHPEDKSWSVPRRSSRLRKRSTDWETEA